ncbi:MAG: hypothetical protein WC317_03760 [Candidatus Omnitrophota bacterium]|jgi:hypothetical protein
MISFQINNSLRKRYPLIAAVTKNIKAFFWFLFPPVSFSKSTYYFKDFKSPVSQVILPADQKFVIIGSYDELVELIRTEAFWDRLLIDDVKIRFKEKQLCFAMLLSGKLVAISWCSDNSRDHIYPKIARGDMLNEVPYLYGLLIDRDFIVKRSITMNSYLSGFAVLCDRGYKGVRWYVKTDNRFAKSMAKKLGAQDRGYVNNIRILWFWFYDHSGERVAKTSK